MLNTIGCASGAAIETFSGRLVDITCILPSDCHIVDIAHSLSMQCRYNGHCRKFYSVAEHSCHVHDIIDESWRDSPHHRMMSLAALLHDASESLLCDIPRPLKPILTEYTALELQVQEAICERFGVDVDDELYRYIKDADNIALKTEAQYLMATCGEKWGMGKIEVGGFKVRCWKPKKARRQFLKRFAKWM